MPNYTYPIDPSNPARDRLRTLINRAKNATTHDQSLRIAIFGDSTWTSPGGFGILPMHALTRRLGGLFGNIAGTQLTSLASNSGAPYVRASGQAVQASPLAATYDAAGVYTRGVPFTGEAGAYAADVAFHPYSQEKGATRIVLAGTNFFPTAGQKLEIYCSKRANSAESLLIEYRPTDKAFSLGESILGATETLAVAGLDAAASTYEIVRVRTVNAYTPSVGKPFPARWIKSAVATTVGAGAKAPPLVNGVRILNASPVGAIIDTFSAGGYLTRQWFGDTITGGGGGNHVNAAGQIAQMRHDVWVFAYGLNDYYGGISAADQRRNYYDPSGANNPGMIGKHIAANESRGIPVPIIVIITPPFRADDGLGTYAAYKAQHAAALAQLQSLVDQLQAAGYDAILRDVKSESDSLGFNATINDYQGLTNRGTYDTGGIVYNAGDYYLSPVDLYYYRCLATHTSSSTTEPTDDGANGVAILHMPLHIHLDGTPSGTNWVHESALGAAVKAECIANFFAEHSGPGSITLSTDSIEAIKDAIKDDATIAQSFVDAGTAATNSARAVELAESDAELVNVAGVQKLKRYQRGTDTEILTAKTAKQPGGEDLTNPTLQRLAGFRE